MNEAGAIENEQPPVVLVVHHLTNNQNVTPSQRMQLELTPDQRAQIAEFELD